MEKHSNRFDLAVRGQQTDRTDVYKRQDIKEENMAREQQQNEKSLFVQHHLAAVLEPLFDELTRILGRLFGLGNAKELLREFVVLFRQVAPEPVSYTHLDVYKRQRLP